MAKKIKFSQLFNEQFIKSIRKDLKAEFEDVDLNTPYVKKIIVREAKVRNKSVQEITDELQARLDQGMLNFQNANQRQNAVNMKNMIEGILFDYISPSEKVPKVTLKQLKEMIKWVRVSNPAFFKLKDPITGKKVKVSIHITPAPKMIKQPAWMQQVTTAAATANGELIFNVEFCKQLIQYAYTKGVKPAGGMYESNGGTIPDAYAYIEFLILHEIYHIVHADHFYGAVDLYNLMVKEGPTRWPKLLQSAGWTGTTTDKRGRRSLRRAARAANGQIQNYVGDYITNYELVKKGYAQLPIGLFATDYNYDNFDSMEDIQIAVLDDMEEGTPDPKDSMLDKMNAKQAQMDEHLDANNQQNGSQEQQDGGGAPSPGGAPEMSPEPDEEEIANMSAEELADMLDKSNGGGGGGGPELTPEEIQDQKDIEDAIKDAIDKKLNDPDVSEEEKQKIRDALDKKNQDGDSSQGDSGDGEDSDGDSGDSGDSGDGGEPSDSDDNQGGQGNSAKAGSDEVSSDAPDEQNGGGKSTQDKIDDAMKETNEDGDMLSADERDELTPEEVDRRIKEMEEEAEAEEEDRQKSIEAAKEARKQQRAAAKAAEGERKPTNPINWKQLLKKMIPKPIETEEESITKMHNRTKSSLAAAMDSKDNDGVAIKAGIIKDEKNIQKLLFVLDNSGSMSETISGVNPDIMRVIEKSKKNGIEDMYIIKFDSNWDVYKIDLDKTGKKHKFRQFKNNRDIVKKAKDLNDEKKVTKLLDKNSHPIEQLFQEQWGGGTTFPVEMSKVILQLIAGKDGAFNGVMFTDTDILGDGNMEVLKKIALTAAKRPFSFNIILDSRQSYNAVKPKLSGYKYLSYIGNKELQDNSNQ